MKSIFILRPAIALVELIFAIVVIGIVMMSAPMLIERSTSSSYVAFQQESIAAAAVQINMIMLSEWDYWDTNATIGEPVLKTDSTVLHQCTGSAGYPAGVTATSGRYCTSLGGSAVFYSATPPSLFGPEGNELSFYDDVDDYDKQSYTVKTYNYENYSICRGDYRDQNITVTSRVYYGDDVPKNSGGVRGSYSTTTTFSNPFKDINSTHSTNIKLIKVTLTSNNSAAELADKKITLSAFMCNIGAPKKILTNESKL